MLNFIYKSITELEAVTSDFDVARAAEAEGKRVKNRNDFGCMAEAKGAAHQASELTGEKYVPVDHGSHHHPRWDVVRAPHIGDEVSYAFNGDYYPCGTVTKISASLRRVETSEGRVFYRRKETGAWINNGTWSLIQGHVDKRNPSF